MTHRPKSKPELDSAQKKHLQHKVRIQNTTSLHTSPSRQIQELTGQAHRSTRWLHQDRKTKSLLTRLHHPRYCAHLFSIPFCVGFCEMNRLAVSKALSSPCLVHGGLGRPKHCCVTIAVYSVSFLVPARTICRSS